MEAICAVGSVHGVTLIDNPLFFLFRKISFSYILFSCVFQHPYVFISIVAGEWTVGLIREHPPVTMVTNFSVS
jgi:hypothetical protein